jgi:hypothetical protein
MVVTEWRGIIQFKKVVWVYTIFHRIPNDESFGNYLEEFEYCWLFLNIEVKQTIISCFEYHVSGKKLFAENTLCPTVVKFMTCRTMQAQFPFIP